MAERRLGICQLDAMVDEALGVAADHLRAGDTRRCWAALQLVGALRRVADIVEAEVLAAYEKDLAT